jgi:hypothetical protein
MYDLRTMNAGCDETPSRKPGLERGESVQSGHRDCVNEGIPRWTLIFAGSSR